MDVSTKLFFRRLILEYPKLSYKGKIPTALHQDFQDLLVSILYIKHHVQIQRAACAPAGDYDIIYSLIMTYDAASGHGAKACCVYLHIQSRRAADGSIRITCHLILSRNRINGISSNDHQVIVELDSMRLGIICFKLAEAMLPFKIHRKLFLGDSLTAVKMLHKSSLGFQVGVANILDLVHRSANIQTEVFHVAGTHLLCGVDKLTRPSKHPELLLTPEWFTGNFVLPWNCILELTSPLGPAAPLKDLPGHRKEIVMLGLENLPSTQATTALRIQSTKPPVRESSFTKLLQKRRGTQYAKSVLANVFTFCLSGSQTYRTRVLPPDSSLIAFAYRRASLQLLREEYDSSLRVVESQFSRSRNYEFVVEDGVVMTMGRRIPLPDSMKNYKFLDYRTGNWMGPVLSNKSALARLLMETCHDSWHLKSPGYHAAKLNTGYQDQTLF